MAKLPYSPELQDLAGLVILDRGLGVFRRHFARGTRYQQQPTSAVVGGLQRQRRTSLNAPVLELFVGVGEEAVVAVAAAPALGLDHVLAHHRRVSGVQLARPHPHPPEVLVRDPLASRFHCEGEIGKPQKVGGRRSGMEGGLRTWMGG